MCLSLYFTLYKKTEIKIITKNVETPQNAILPFDISELLSSIRLSQLRFSISIVFMFEHSFIYSILNVGLHLS